MTVSVVKEAEKITKSVKVLARGYRGRAALPTGGLSSCRAFAIIHTTKGALGVGLEKGAGIAVKVLGENKGCLHLSAPLFLMCTKFSIGASIGVDFVHTAMLLDHDQDIKLFTHGDAVTGHDVTFSGVARSVQETRQPVFSTQSEAHINSLHSGPKIISVAEDSYMLLDLSFTGGALGPDDAMNRQVYGEGVTPEQILSGSVEVPAAFAAIMDTLKRNFVTHVDEQAEVAAAAAAATGVPMDTAPTVAAPAATPAAAPAATPAAAPAATPAATPAAAAQ